ncbi:ABC transporter permease [Paenibacillus apiarius]|uniref:ABC transporter permease n=1 Tax=Paenibacillus apiarius TaxID=46240 RepID=A0ABT4DN16_9BACL|nr:ABC transporter permease [Paenibacillus apiarius]MCY9514765.1 ABC transporter permease [Paenibacillus apiarius]MCY9518755.1 ABC transporter permease [Paenibacillus apiarius]MCY9552804.1 ABC transporter permease [Paenibacillus apiarius]MCY9556829.1 ABC transporter permease [Paenibacillus apiarius]MCY9686218.1 ABC transporter permease [Paenibacillus apiarius]
MTFRRLATSNVRGSWHRYSAYFLSSVVAVMIFFVYAAFIYHPDVVNGNIRGGDTVRKMMVACEYLIIIFSFFFTLYSSSAFLKSRQKEFGLLSLFGMTKAQLRRLVFYENMTISSLAIVVGMGIGTIVTKLFLLAMSRMLGVESPIRFYIDSSAILVTVAGYLALFAAISLFSLRKVGRTEIIDLIRSEKQPKKPPKFSWVLVILALFSLMLGYSLAFVTNMELFIATALPTIGFTVLGTYFLFTQLSVAIIRLLQQNKRFYYRRTHLLNVSQAAFKLKDNARVLFNVSILCAVILTATATFYSIDQGMREQTLIENPYVFTLSSTKNDVPVLLPELVKGWGKDDGFEITDFAEIRHVQVKIKGERFEDDYSGMIAVSDYNRMAGILNEPPLSVAGNEAILVNQASVEGYGSIGSRPPADEKKYTGAMKATIDESEHTAMLNVTKRIQTRVLDRVYYGFNLLVVDDLILHKMYKAAPDSAARTIQVYNWNNWENSIRLDQKIRDHLPKNENGNYYVTSRVEMWNDYMHATALTLFIGMFISLLFFLASGSVIYFKLFTDLQDDQAHFRALTRIGLSIKEIRHVVTVQVGLIFFAPCLVGSMHTMFAMKTLSNLMMTNVMWYALIVVGMFVLMQTIYFLAARRAYMKKILEEVVM